MNISLICVSASKQAIWWSKHTVHMLFYQIVLENNIILKSMLWSFWLDNSSIFTKGLTSKFFSDKTKPDDSHSSVNQSYVIC